MLELEKLAASSIYACRRGDLDPRPHHAWASTSDRRPRTVDLDYGHLHEHDGREPPRWISFRSWFIFDF